MIISIELMLLAVTLLVLVSSYQFDDIMGQTYGIYIIETLDEHVHNLHERVAMVKRRSIELKDCEKRLATRMA